MIANDLLSTLQLSIP